MMRQDLWPGPQRAAERQDVGLLEPAQHRMRSLLPIAGSSPVFRSPDLGSQFRSEAEIGMSRLFRLRAAEVRAEGACAPKKSANAKSGRGSPHSS